MIQKCCNGSPFAKASGDRPKKESKLMGNLLVFLVFLVFSAAWFFPVIQHFTTSVAGMGGDPYQTLWRFEKLGEAVKHGSLLVPEEKSFPNLSPLPWLPVYYLFGEIAAYNTAWFFSVILSGFLFYQLARLWGAKFWPALLMGLLLEFAPYRIAQSLGHFGAMQFWVVLAVLICLTIWQQTRKDGWFMIGLLFMVWTMWTDHQLFVALVMILVVLGACYIKKLLSFGKRKILFLTSVSLLVLFIAVFPFAKSLLQISGATNHLNPGDTQRAAFSATLRSILFPAPFALIASGNYHTQISSDNIQTLGIILPTGAILLFIFRKKSKKETIILILSLLGILLSLGSALRVHGISIPLPTKLFYLLPIMSAIRTAGRFIVLPTIFLPLFLALSQKNATRKLWYIIPILCIVEILPALGFPIITPNKAQANMIATSFNSGSILALPGYTNYQYGSETLYYSNFYRHPVVGTSALERIIDPKTTEIFFATPVIRDLVLLRLNDFFLPTIFNQSNRSIASLAFKAQGIGNILLETKPKGGIISFEGNKQTILSDEQVNLVKQYLREILGFSEKQVTETAFVYNVPDLTNSDAQYFIMEGKGWQIKKKTSETVLVELARNSDFYVYADSPVTLDLIMTVTTPRPDLRATVFYGDSRQVVTIGPDNQLKIHITAPAKTYTKYQITLDDAAIMLQNLRIQNNS
jgi:hypothetical protein